VQDAPDPTGRSASDRREADPPDGGVPEGYRHSVDLRFTTPRWLGHFYFDLRMGHDQRGGTRPYVVPVSVTRRNRVIASVLVQMLISWCAFMALLVAWLFQMGCGAGLGPDISAGGRAGAGGTGAISVQVAWPEVSAEMIPSAARSVKLVVTKKDTGDELGQAVIPQGTETATLGNLPAGVVCVVTATAHPNTDGTGTAQAKAVQEVTIPDGSDVPVSFTLQSSISTVEPAQTELSGQLGGTAQLTATAKDELGNAVLVEETWTYQSSNPGIASVNASGLVTFASVGTVTITITEEESGHTGSVTVHCTSPPPLFTDGPPFPRIANLYGAELPAHDMTYPARPEFTGTRLQYWSNVDLFAGCGIFYAWNWEHNTYNATARSRLTTAMSAIRAANPYAEFLSYDFGSTYSSAANDMLPEWILDASKRSVNLANADAIAYLETKVNQYDVNDFGLDGVFFDEPKWSAYPLAYAAACNVAAGAGQPIVMGNAWSITNWSALDKTLVNGVLSEDELNRVLLGKPGYSFAATIGEYLEWTTEAKSPRTTIIAVCSPNPYCDGWMYDYTGWKALTAAQQDALIVSYKDANPSVFRFGLTAALLGDGYFAYDMGGIHRGVWWWYPEYDAPLGYPTSLATVRGDGAWQREYQGGTVVCNPTSSAVTVDFPAPRRDVSTSTETTSFSVPARDGRLFLVVGS